MAPLLAHEGQAQLDPAVQVHIANLAKCGIKWTPPSSKRPASSRIEEHTQVSPIAPTVVSPPVYTGPKHPRKVRPSLPEPPSEPESESEMMGSAYQKKFAIAEKKRNALAQGPSISRDEADKLDAEAFEDLALKTGDKVTKLETFIPWRFLVRYGVSQILACGRAKCLLCGLCGCVLDVLIPWQELYVGKTNKSIVESYFDDANIFDTQAWDFFYLYDPETLADNVDPVLFVRTVQLQALLRKINKKYGFALMIPDGGNDVKFHRQFPRSTPLPRYLDRTNARSSYSQLLRYVPLPDPEDDLTKATQADREEFAEVIKRCKESWDGAHGKRKGSKMRKNAITRYESRKTWGRATKRVQRWLGLRHKTAPVVSHAEFTSRKKPATKPIFDANAPAPYEFDDDVVFICLDNETDENNAQVVTETGFGILDTRDLKGVAPGEGAENWFKLIKARHLRVKEYLHIGNHKYVEGCPENFRFG